MADQDRASASTRKGEYVPPLPEKQSCLSRWMVRFELSVIVAIAGSVLFCLKQSSREESSPVRVASAPIMTSMVAGGSMSNASAIADAGDGADPSKGQVLFMQSCTSCHGQSAQGLPHMGVSLRDSRFVAKETDRKLVAFLKTGRKPTDPKNTTGLLMPPRGGNVGLDDDSLADIVAFLRQVQKQHGEENAAAELSAPTSRPVARTDSDSTTGARAE
jgi:cytochrome c5